MLLWLTMPAVQELCNDSSTTRRPWAGAVYPDQCRWHHMIVLQLSKYILTCLHIIMGHVEYMACEEKRILHSFHCASCVWIICKPLINQFKFFALTVKSPTLLLSGNYHVSNQTTAMWLMPLVPPAHLATLPHFLHWPCKHTLPKPEIELPTWK